MHRASRSVLACLWRHRLCAAAWAVLASGVDSALGGDRCFPPCVGSPEGEKCGTDTNGGCNAPGGSSDCCVANGGLGCDDPACSAVVCLTDPSCCSDGWDEVCAAEAATLCGHLCLPGGGDAFGSISCGETICATAWADGGVRDTDWFKVTVSEPTRVTLSCIGEMPMVFGLVNSTDCATATRIDPLGATQLCAQTHLDICLSAGENWLFAAPNGFIGYPCDGGNNEYWLALSCGEFCGVPLCGDGICAGGETAATCPQDCDESALCPDEGDCGAAHPGPGCEDFLCCQFVCAIDPTCCNTEWDASCAQLALEGCSAPPACPGACTGDLTGDGAIDGADVATVLGGWGTGSACSDLDGDGNVGGGDLAIVLGAWGLCPVVAAPPSTGFGQARVGDVNIEGVAIVNRSPRAAVVTGISVPPGPFVVEAPLPDTIEPHSSAPLIVRYGPQGLGEHSATIVLHLDDGRSVPVAVEGEGIPDQDSPPEEWLDLGTTPASIARTADDAVVYSYQLEVLPRGPVSYTHQAATMEFSVAEAPPSLLVGLPVIAAPFGSFGPFPLEIIGPPEGAAPGDRVVLTVVVRNPLGAIIAVYFVNVQPPQAPPAGPSCDCSPPASHSKLADSTTYFPDSPIPASDVAPGASKDKVAQVLVRIDGPKAGECCVGANSSFVMRTTVSADFAADGEFVHRNHTAHTLIRACRGEDGMSIKATTCGIEHPITSAPGSSFACDGTDELPDWGETIGNMVLTTSWTTPIVCTNAEPWPCTVRKNDHVTEISFNGADSQAPGTGGLQVFWRVDAGGQECQLAPSAATIKRVLFIRNDDVYSPDRHATGWINRSADPDGDGRNNHRELMEGTDPHVAD